MSSLLERARPKKAAAPTFAFGATLPQVNLLPPTIHAKRALGRTKRMLGYAMLAVVALIVGGWFVASGQRSAQEQRLVDAQSESTRLVKSQAQYAEAPRVLGQVTTALDARAQGFSTDVDWFPYVQAVFAVLPTDTKITSIAYAGATPMLLPAPAVDPLQVVSSGQLAFTTRTTEYLDTTDWVERLNKVPGFSDAWVSDVTVGSNDKLKDGYYEVTSTVQVNESAFSGRFDEKDN